MVKYLHRRCHQSKWLESPEDDYGSTDSATPNIGVILKRPDGLYSTEPQSLQQDVVKSVERLGVPVAFTMSSEITQALLQQITPFQTELRLDSRGYVLPIVGSVRDIGSPKSAVTREAYMCLCRNERFVLVWGDSVQSILAHASEVETGLVGLVSLAEGQLD